MQAAPLHLKCISRFRCLSCLKESSIRQLKLLWPDIDMCLQATDALFRGRCLQTKLWTTENPLSQNREKSNVCLHSSPHQKHALERPFLVPQWGDLCRSPHTLPLTHRAPFLLQRNLFARWKTREFKTATFASLVKQHTARSSDCCKCNSCVAQTHTDTPQHLQQASWLGSLEVFLATFAKDLIWTSLTEFRTSFVKHICS